MAQYKVIFDGEELEDIFDSYQDAEDAALYESSCWHTGSEILELSNPGDYPYDPDDAPEYEIVEI